MSLSTAMQDRLNKQLKAELDSAYLYLSMAAHCEEQNLKGFSHWLRMQEVEEREHAMKIFQYIADRGGRIALDRLEKPQSSWSSPLAAAEDVLSHERHVTAMIHELAEAAIAEKDHATETMLHWFISEQVEEEAQAADLVQRLKIAGTSGPGLYIIDRELSQRK